MPQVQGAAFTGFTPVSGWEALAGPIAEAFLPLFHWALGPDTHLTVTADAAQTRRLEAEVMSYAERQVTTVLLNGAEVFRFVFPRVNQKERLMLLLPLRAGENQLVFRHHPPGSKPPETPANSR